MKEENNEFDAKCRILEEYEQKYGIFVSLKKREIMFS